MAEAYSSKWGNRLVIAQLLGTNFATLTSYTANTNCLDLKDIRTQSDTLSTNVTKFNNVAGNPVATDKVKDGGSSATMFSKKKSLVDYLSVTVDSSPFHLEIMDMGIEQGFYQELFKIVDIAPNRTRTAQEYGMNYVSSVIFPSSSVTFTTTNLALITTALSITLRTTTAVTITANTDSTTIETAVP